MPEMNGLAFLKTIRTGRSRCRRDLPIALLTGNSTGEAGNGDRRQIPVCDTGLPKLPIRPTR
jgi:CheY-like chemotaxis protein